MQSYSFIYHFHITLRNKRKLKNVIQLGPKK